MSKFKKFLYNYWQLFIVLPTIFFLGVMAISKLETNKKLQDQANKLCYPYVVMAQTDEIVVCAGVDHPVVKNRK
jgi:hypothetical protein